MADERTIGRFPVPERWILERLPKELHGLFGARQEPSLDDEDVSDEIQYTYTFDIPGGGTMKKALLVECVPDGSPAVVFLIGDTVEVDGVPLVVRTWDTRDVSSQNGLRGYRVHQVDTTLAAPRA